jgi:xylulokinase
MDVYAGVDFGTSGARIAVVDREGCRCFATGHRFSKQVLANLTTNWQQTLFTLLEQVPGELRSHLTAIAINGTSSTVLLCDAMGQPITDPLLYNDARAASEISTLRTLFAQEQLAQTPFAQTTGRDTVLSATSSLVKLLWWSRQSFFSQAKYFLHQADWLAWLLHGRLGISDYHNSLKLGYDVVRLEYPDWLRSLPIAPLLPQVVTPGTVVGRVQPAIATRLGLPAHCQVCAGTTDSIAAFLASGASSPGAAVTSLGSTLVLKLLSHIPVENGQYGIYSHRLGDLWLVGGASNTGGAVLQQFFSPTELEQLSAEIVPDQNSPLDYYPLPRPGERFPINDPNLLPRLEPRPDNPVEFLHGLLDSMARIEARAYQLLRDLGATPLTQVYTAGGGASNPAWTALRARYLGVPVQASTQTEAAYGTALLARSLTAVFT